MYKKLLVPLDGTKLPPSLQKLGSGPSIRTWSMSRWPRTLGGRHALISGFRVAACVIAITQLSLDDTVVYYPLPPLSLIIAGALYTALKLIQPPRWNQAMPLGPVLLVLDLLICASLFAFSTGIHSPFALYTLAPVLTSALLFSRRLTLATAIATSAYVLFLYIDDPTVSLAQHLGSWLSIYLVALVLAAILPYAINAVSKRQLHFQAMLDERLRLGREIHDELCQDVCGLRWELQMLRRDASCSEHLANRLTYFQGLLERVEEKARESIELLRAYKDNRPFLSQLEGHVGRLREDTGMNCRVEAESREPRLDEMVKFEVLHICQEALRNVAKHSQARNVTVTVQAGKGHLRIDIADDGCGFADAKFVEGRGLTVMKERAESIGGRLELVTTPGMGTEIKVEVPRQCPAELPMMRL